MTQLSSISSPQNPPATEITIAHLVNSRSIDSQQIFDNGMPPVKVGIDLPYAVAEGTEG